MLRQSLAKLYSRRTRLPHSRYSLHDLKKLDAKYAKMHRLQEEVHRQAIQTLGGGPGNTVLEIACGTGVNVPLFKDTGMIYHGLDISETAVAVALLKFPEGTFFNMSVLDLGLFREQSFDYVYNSSMLEHIGSYAEALQAMLRLFRQRLCILFFEGLSDAEQSTIDFHPWQESHIARDGYEDVFGVKNAAQNHLHEQRQGWYWNRYCRREITAILHSAGCKKFTILDKANTPWLTVQALLIIDR